MGSSQVVQWLGLCVFAAEGPGFNLWLGKPSYCKSCGTVTKKKKGKGKENFLLFPDLCMKAHFYQFCCLAPPPPLQVTNNPKPLKTTI